MRLFYCLLLITYVAFTARPAHGESSSSSPEGSGGHAVPTATATATAIPTVPPTPTPRNRICRNDPATEVQCGPGTNVGVNYKIMCTSVAELFRAMNVVAPAWIPYWTTVENWIPWIDLGGQVRLVTNWQTAANPAQYNYSQTGYFWTDINPLYDPVTGLLVQSGEFNRNVSHCVTTTGLLCGCGRNMDDGCFPPGVAITMADGNTKLVEDVVAGDFIWNPVKKAPRKVLQIVEGPEKRPLITVRTAQNTLSMSQEHPVRVVDQTSQPLLRVALNSPRSDKSDSSWKIQQAKDLRVGSIIQLASGDPAEITSVEQTPAEEGLYVINFVLEGNPDDVTERMLVADGIVTGDLVLQQRLAKGNLANKHD